MKECTEGLTFCPYTSMLYVQVYVPVPLHPQRLQENAYLLNQLSLWYPGKEGKYPSMQL